MADKVQTDTHVFHPPDRAATEGSLSLVRAVVVIPSHHDILSLGIALVLYQESSHPDMLANVNALVHHERSRSS